MISNLINVSLIRFRNPDRKTDKLLSAHKSALWLILPGIMPARIEFTDEQLEEMIRKYEEGASSEELAERFGVSKHTILRRLKENGCKIKSVGGSYVKRYILDPWEDVNAAYVFGVLIGDASLMYNKNNSKGVSLRTPDEEFSGAFVEAVESAFEIQVNKHPEYETPSFRVYSVDLGESYDQFKWRTETWRVPRLFFDAPNGIKIALCQRKFDSDGKVEKSAIEVNSIRKTGLEDMRTIVQGLGYETTLRGPYTKKGPSRKDQYTLRILDASYNLLRLPRKKKALLRANK